MKPQRQHRLGLALAGVQQALIARGVDPGQAMRYAQVVLSRPGVTIGRGGHVRYQGQSYKAAAFAGTKLADYVTGLQAQHQNQAAIQGDPNYQTDLANLTLQQQLSTAGLDDQQRRAILDFGSPAYTQDPLLAGEAAANPFSVEALLSRQLAQNRSQAGQAANRVGTLFGGGQVSGQAQAQRSYAGQQADATQQLVDLIAGLGQQRSQAQSIFDTGRQTSLQQTTAQLMSSGAIHAAQAPHLQVGQYHFLHRVPHVPHVPPPPPPPRTANRPYPTPQPPVNV